MSVLSQISYTAVTKLNISVFTTDNDLSQTGSARTSGNSAGSFVPGLRPGWQQEHSQHGLLPGDLGLPGLHLHDARRPEM
jgi:hypothetical protein